LQYHYCLARCIHDPPLIPFGPSHAALPSSLPSPTACTSPLVSLQKWPRYIPTLRHWRTCALVLVLLRSCSSSTSTRGPLSITARSAAHSRAACGWQRLGAAFASSSLSNFSIGRSPTHFFCVVCGAAPARVVRLTEFGRDAPAGSCWTTARTPLDSRLASSALIPRTWL
jgi:hypothetical protein